MFRGISNPLKNAFFLSKRFHNNGPRAKLTNLYNKTSSELMKLEELYTPHNYHPLPVVYSRASGVHVWDPEGKHYYDFLSAYSAVNQGHCHPKIIKACIDQLTRCTLSSRAFFNEQFPQFAEYITGMFGYQKVLPMNSGAEAGETAMKVARKWGYERKGIKENEAIIISATGCFHGRTIAIISLSDDPEATGGYGPLLPGLRKVTYNDIDSLKQVLDKEGDKVAAFIIEPIQGEAGVVVPDDQYMREVRNLCTKHNVLLILDEIQSGLCRSGKLLASEYPGIKGDMLVLGKALSGGILPLSAVLADDKVMDVLRPGQHGSTFGGNPMACAVGRASLEVLVEENLAEKSFRLGNIFREELQKIKEKVSFVDLVRGRGLLNGVVIHEQHKINANILSDMLRQHGLLAKPTREHIIRFAPPLIMNDQQMAECLDIIETVFVKADKGIDVPENVH